MTRSGGRGEGRGAGCLGMKEELQYFNYLYDFYYVIEKSKVSQYFIVHILRHSALIMFLYTLFNTLCTNAVKPSISFINVLLDVT